MKGRDNREGEYLQLVAFRVGKEEYSVPILQVQEIIRVPEITRVPRVPNFVEGVINLRGRVIPVVDLRKRFGLAEVTLTRESRILVIESGEKTVGFIVDSVSEVLRLPVSALEPPPGIPGRTETEYIEGIGKLDNRLLVVLNPDRLLSWAGVGPSDKGSG